MRNEKTRVTRETRQIPKKNNKMSDTIFYAPRMYKAISKMIQLFQLKTSLQDVMTTYDSTNYNHDKHDHSADSVLGVILSNPNIIQNMVHLNTYWSTDDDKKKEFNEAPSKRSKDFLDGAHFRRYEPQPEQDTKYEEKILKREDTPSEPCHTILIMSIVTSIEDQLFKDLNREGLMYPGRKYTYFVPPNTATHIFSLGYDETFYGQVAKTFGMRHPAMKTEVKIPECMYADASTSKYAQIRINITC